MKPLLAAFRFLTILPLGRRSDGPGDLAGSILFFPVVGLFIGAAAMAFSRCRSARTRFSIL